jgi:hypothetical protein
MIGAKSFYLSLRISCALVVLSVSVAFAEQPKITNFIPTIGSPGDTLIINGSGFAFSNLSSNKVKFGGKKASVLLSPSANQIVAVVPQEATSGPITVQNRFGNYTSNNIFEIKKSTVPVEAGDIPGKGDRKVLNTYLGGFTLSEINSPKRYYATPGSILWVTSKPDKNGDVIVRFKENWTNSLIGTEVENEDYKKENDALVKPDISYKINAAHLQNCAAKSRGLDYGLLVIPYKLHLNDHSLSGESSVGGYAGMQLNTPGVALSLVLSAGIGVVPTTTTETDGTVKTGHAASFTGAGGLIFTFSRISMFQVGLIAGVDLTGKGSQYKYDGKPWIAVSFGTNLTK